MISVAEILAQKRVLDKKIKELRSAIKSNQYEDLASELFKLLEQRQSKLLNIDAANNMSKINIGGTEISVASAIRIRDTIKQKIDVLTMLITDTSNSLDKLSLQKQRDSFYNEYILLTLALMKNDLQVTME